MLEAFDAPGAYAPAELPPDYVSPQNITRLRLATAGYFSTEDGELVTYPPRIIGEVEVAQTCADAIGLGGVVALTASELQLAGVDEWAADLERYNTAAFRDAEIRLAPVTDGQASDFGTAYDATSLGFAGTVRQVTRAGDRQFRLVLSDVTERLAVPVQPSLYGGTGGLDGQANLASLPKPVCLGRCFNVAPVFVGIVDLGDGLLYTYQSNWRAIVEHAAVRIRGVAQNLVTVAPTTGQYRDWPSLGLFQLGSTPDGDVTADVRGDAVGGYVNTTATILRRLLNALGPQFGDADFDGAAWSLADFDLAGEVGFYLGAQAVSALEAASSILAGCGGVLAGGRGGQLRLFDPIAVDVPQFDIPAAWCIDCRPAEVPARFRPPPAEIRVQWGRCWQTVGTPAASVDATLRTRLSSGRPSVASYRSALIAGRVARQGAWELPGLYWDTAAAQARAEALGGWLEAGLRCFTVSTDRYLGQIELGHIGRVTYPAYGLDAGMVGTVIAWRESFGGRRLEITLLGSA